MKKINNCIIRHILDEWAKEIGKNYIMFYRIVKRKIFLYSPYLGYFIGAEGKIMKKYFSRLKDEGISKVILVDVKDTRLPDYDNYDNEECYYE